MCKWGHINKEKYSTEYFPATEYSKQNKKQRKSNQSYIEKSILLLLQKFKISPASNFKMSRK